MAVSMGPIRANEMGERAAGTGRLGKVVSRITKESTVFHLFLPVGMSCESGTCGLGQTQVHEVTRTKPTS